MFTLVEPGFEFFDRKDNDYPLFLERCARVCYKSEGCIRPGSAEKLLNKIIKKYEHVSILEHENCILDIKPGIDLDKFVFRVTGLIPLFSDRISVIDYKTLRMSGNLRMWSELVQRSHTLTQLIWAHIEHTLSNKYPLFFSSILCSKSDKVTLIDSNPITNINNLNKAELLKHMTMTYKVVCSRSASHQIVRHRKFSFAQESQRYVNYGKKGFQVIRPKSISDKIDSWTESINNCCLTYLGLLGLGVLPEDARSVLPNCMKTEIVMTATLDMWKYIFKHRADNPKAQQEIRECMQGIKMHAMSVLPGCIDK